MQRQARRWQVPALGPLPAPCRFLRGASAFVPVRWVPRAYYPAFASGIIYGLYDIESQQICRLPVIQLLYKPR